MWINTECSQQYLFSLYHFWLFVVVGFYFIYSCLCQNQSFLITVDFCLSPEEFINVFYISSSAKEMTSVESQHERGGIIRGIKGIFTSWPQSLCCFLRNAAITMCIMELPCVLWGKQAPAGHSQSVPRSGVKNECCQKCVLADMCFHTLYGTAVSLLGVSVSSWHGETFVSPHFRLT